MKKSLLIIFLITLTTGIAFGDTITINHFVIKENPFAKNEIAIVATDTANNTLEKVRGIFSFTVNGFQESLTFEKGASPFISINSINQVFYM